MKALFIPLFLTLPFLALAQPGEKTPCRIVYVPTEQVVVEKMLEMAKVKKTDIVFDLGCGDGRIVAHDYPFPNMDPDQTVEFDIKGPRPKYLYMWTIKK